MKRLYTLLILFLVLCSGFNQAQVQRNPVLEYCTGTWCQWCPCGHEIIRNTILQNIPNTIVLGYHGPSNSSDPFRNFAGNTIIGSLGFSSYPTGIVDRTSAPISRSAWYSTVNNRLTVNATVDISIFKTYSSTSRQLQLTVMVNPLEALNGQFKYNVVLLEDSLIANQTGNSSCTGGATYRHDHVVRGMINGALGEDLNVNQNWNPGEVISKTVDYIVPAEFNEDYCHLAVFVYKVGTSVNTSNIQQAKQYTLIGNILPVELTSFTASVDQVGINLLWSTASETNNKGFEIERSIDGENYSLIGFINGAGTTTENQSYSFKDKLLNSGVFYFRLKQLDFSGDFEYSEVIMVKFELPLQFSLEQNYPNPFNPETVIKYSVPKNSNVVLKVYDIIGREISTLVDGNIPAGNHEVSFNADNLSSGVYIYKITAGEYTSIKKMSILK